MRTLRHIVERSRLVFTEGRGEMETGTPTKADIRCQINEGEGRIEVKESGLKLKYDATMICRNAADIQDGDEVKQTTPSSGKKFKVLHVADRAGRAHHKTVYLEFLESD